MPIWVGFGHLKAGPGARAAVKETEWGRMQSTMEAHGRLSGGLEEGRGFRGGAEVACAVTSASMVMVSQGTGSVARPERAGRQYTQAWRRAVRTWEAGPGAHRPSAFLSRPPHFSSLFHHHSPWLKTSALKFLLFFFHLNPFSYQILVVLFKCLKNIFDCGKIWLTALAI